MNKKIITFFMAFLIVMSFASVVLGDSTPTNYFVKVGLFDYATGDAITPGVVTLGGVVLETEDDGYVRYPVVDSNEVYDVKGSVQGYETVTIDTYFDPNLRSCSGASCSLQSSNSYGYIFNTECSLTADSAYYICDSTNSGTTMTFIYNPDLDFIYIPLYLPATVQNDNSAPVVSVSSDKTTGDWPLEVDFTYSVSDVDNNVHATHVFFGDGTSKIDVSASGILSHTYTKPGTYKAYVYSYDDGGLSDKKEITIVVTGQEIQPEEFFVKIGLFDWDDESPITSGTVTLGGVSALVDGEGFARFPVVDSNNVYDVTGQTSGYETLTIDTYFDPAIRSFSADVEQSTSYNDYGTEFLTICDMTDSLYLCDVVSSGTTFTYVYNPTLDFVYIPLFLTKIDTPNNVAPVIVASVDKVSGDTPLNVLFTWAVSDVDDNLQTTHVFYGDGNTDYNVIAGSSASHTYTEAGTYNAFIYAYDDNGKSVRKDFTIVATRSTVANVNPIANAGNDITITLGEVANFDGSASSDSDGFITSYSWDFNDGNVGTGVGSSNTYAAVGTYTVTLTVTDEDGLTHSDSLTVVVNPVVVVNQLPVADAGNAQTVMVGDVVSFDASASYDTDGSIVSYSWDFNDGIVGTGLTSTHTYAIAGTYTVTLTVTDNDGAVDTHSVLITVNIPSQLAPVADAGNVQTVIVGDVVTFDGSNSFDADGMIVSYVWDFNDGNVGTGVSPSNTYTVAGTYTVTLTVTDNDGVSDMSFVIITVNTPGNLLPMAFVDWYGIVLEVDIPVIFDGSLSDDFDGTIVSYVWDFGDGNSATGVSPSNTYTTAGDYIVTLTVTDNDGGIGVDSYTITINTPANLAPISDAGNAQGVEVNTLVTFDGSASYDADFIVGGHIVSYLWDFTDGTTATGVSATHTFTSAGTYTVALTVTDNGGASDTSFVTITVSIPTNIAPIADAGNDMTVNQGASVLFDGGDSYDPDGAVVNYSWDFNDGTTGDGEITTHAFADKGIYVVTLTVTDNHGATHSDTMIVKVDGEPTAVIVGSASAFVDEEIEFDGSDSTDDEQIVSYVWNFNDGTIVAGEKVTHAFLAEGIYTVTLTVTDNNGLANLASFVVTVSEEPFNAAGREITMARITSVNGGMVMPGDMAVYKFTFVNTGSEDLENLRVTASIPELGIWSRVGPFDLDEDDRASKQILLEIPEYTMSGEEYMVRFTMSQGGESFRTKHRFIEII